MRNEHVFMNDTGEWTIYRCVPNYAYTRIQDNVYRYRRGS